MTNIIRIVLSDWKRLSSNVVAVVVIIGLSVIPCLYAWFNILSNWAPYEKDATSRLSVAIASEDRGMVLEGKEINIGDTIVENLEANDSINWVVTDTAHEAIGGVESGEFYAALVVDADFSANIVSFLGGELEHPEIHYYENEKKNAIAPKITGKVKNTVQNTVNRTFVSTIAEVILEAGKYLVDTDSEKGITDSVLSRLERLDGDLSLCIAMLDSYIALIDSTENLMSAAQSVTNEMDTMIDSAKGVADSASAAANAAEASVDVVSDTLSASIAAEKQQLSNAQSELETLIREFEQTGTVTAARIDGLQNASAALSTGFNAAIDAADARGVNTDDYAKEIAAVNGDIEVYSKDLKSLQDAANLTSEQAAVLLNRLNGDIISTTNSLDNLANTYKSAVEPQIDGSVNTVESSLLEVKNLLNYSGSGISEVTYALGSYPDMLSLGRETLVKSRDEVSEMQDKLEELIDTIENLSDNEQYAMVLKLMQTDPEIIAEFISEPVGIDQQSIYPVENNGSATSPFYIVLSIWVGSLIMVAIMHTKVHPIEGVTDMRTYQEFFGRYVTFFVIGQIQTAITVLGAMFYVGIQCQHKFLFWLACAVTSLAFTLIMYSLTYAFEAVGEALAVVLMVIQVAGSGGTFPIEVLPAPFQYIYKYMPFMHAMNALRECIGGMYENDYFVYVSGLFVYVGVSIAIGLFLSVPCRKLLKMIDESKERTDLLI